jgi:uncharacterized damage-inducible protein DinB
LTEPIILNGFDWIRLIEPERFARMNARQAIEINLNLSEYIALGYLKDLTPPDLLHRPAANANHILWQLGHLIRSEHQIMEQVFPGSMPSLPEGFSDRYSSATADSDQPAAFDSLDVLLALFREQRQGTLSKLHEVTDDQLDQATPESIRSYAPTVAAAFSMQGTHWVMHAGQWAVIRRQLGLPPLY